MSTVCVGVCILICSPKIFALLSSGAKWVRELEATHFQSSLSSCDPKGLRIPILSKTGFGLSSIKVVAWPVSVCNLKRLVSEKL